MALDRLVAWMKSSRVGAAFLTDPVSIAYLTGFGANPHERLMALVVHDGEAVLVVPGLEEESASASARGVAVRGGGGGEDPGGAGAGAPGGGRGGGGRRGRRKGPPRPGGRGR